MIHYQELAPHPRLAAFVECYWLSRGRPAPGPPPRTRVLPDGCMDVLLEVGDASLPERGRPHGLRAYVVGTMPTAAVFLLRGEVDLVGVRFRPGAAPAFLRERADVLTGRVAPLEAFWGAAGERLRERIGETPEPAARAAILDEALLRRLGAGTGSGARAGVPAAGRGGDRGWASAGDPRLAAAVSALTAAGGSLPLAELELASGLGRRQLQRRFRESVGLSPRTFARVLRLRIADRLLRRTPASLAAVALRAGYADQAHLTREFRALAGITPARRRRDVANLQDAGAGDR